MKDSSKERFQYPKDIYSIPYYGAAKRPGGSPLFIMLTSRCPLRCRHCMAPHDNLAYVDITQELLDKALTIKEEISNLRAVELTGGEPFLRVDLIQSVLEKGREYDLGVSIVTSAFWAKSEAFALDMVSQMKGVECLIISTDRFHRASIPPENVINAIKAAVRLGIPEVILLITLETRSHSEIEKLLRPYGKLDWKYRTHLKYAINYLVPVGRAKELAGFQTFPAREFDRPCRSLTGLAVHPNGDVHGCCGPIAFSKLNYPNPLLLGNLRHNSWAHIRKSYYENPIVRMLSTLGPCTIFRIIEESFNVRLIRNRGYTDICHLCVDLLTRMDSWILLSSFVETVEKDLCFSDQQANK